MQHRRSRAAQRAIRLHMHLSGVPYTVAARRVRAAQREYERQVQLLAAAASRKPRRCAEGGCESVDLVTGGISLVDSHSFTCYHCGWEVCVVCGRKPVNHGFELCGCADEAIRAHATAYAAPVDGVHPE
ncbi:hypothetical protein [Prauserella muralis]|uniref:Uncharacterized protein n=1 Tax=Prauserella muralis TaxID=588067 RepID=A0A2V4ADC0_9PSEU|nr:hypothetical protein [Prauserella muralis]PXY16584.1 hypothetical protein BAY60_35920 [Prauserella muralis]TWE11172.1 hypothetical protein FHX69_7391 [Prauserella muralis]